MNPTYLILDMDVDWDSLGKLKRNLLECKPPLKGAVQVPIVETP